jgi:5-hydroxyisourate hydrolase
VITTHVLDTARGEPARGVKVRLERAEGDGFAPVGEQVTDVDGRARALVPDASHLVVGRYRLTFETGAYQQSRGATSFFPRVQIEFEITDAALHYHVPLLLSLFGYTTYRGS